ncbi:MAG: ChuX/HutX family heme-like substrate-binding protein, partial [Bacteroidia bacterium]|nr:ChuX/HutX family heme-like substrate-binding protein [Bacteroidia bacterium]
MKYETLADALELKARWLYDARRRPHVRIRDFAAEYGVSEAQLLALKCGETVTRLSGDWKRVVLRFPELGPCMALTRNEAVVSEIKGSYREAQFFDGGVGQIVDERIDLRLFMNRWHYGFAVEEEGKDGAVRRSLQFFDADGTAVHKVYPESGEGFDKIKADFRSDDQSPYQAVSAPALPAESKSLSELDVEGFLRGWAELKDTHDFFALLRKYGFRRLQALEAATGRFAWPASPEVLVKVLEAVGRVHVPVMVFVGSPGVIQIYSGNICNTLPLERDGLRWFNVLDDAFNLHVREDLIARVFWVQKPTSDGTVTSLEAFDGDDNLVVQLFGKRKPG